MRALGLDPVAVFDDDISKKGERILQVPIMGTLSDLTPSQFDGGVIAVGNNRNRENIARRLHIEWVSVVHPAAYVDPTVKLGAGAVVFAGAIVQPDTTIGEHVIINTAASIDHDCEIGDFVHIAPGVHLAGGIKIGRGSLVGIGSAAIPGIRIGERTTVGAGAVIVRNLPDDIVARGVPARPTRKATD